MAQDDVQPVTRKPRWGRRILIGIGVVLGVLALLTLALLLWLSTESGRDFVVRQIEGLKMQNGLEIEVGDIEGSLFGNMHIRDLALRDPRGVFFTASEVNLDWRPFAYLRSHVDIRTLAVPEARLYRLPEFKATPPSEGPLLPDLDIDVSRLDIGRLQIDAPVTGRRHLVTMAGGVHIADGRAQMSAQARALQGAGIAGGDRLSLVLDAVPRDNRLQLDLKLNAPANGMVAALTGVDRQMSIALSGRGNWERWKGTLTGTQGEDQLADIAISARSGNFRIRGPVWPGLLLAGTGRTMVEPVTRLDVEFSANQRRLTLDGHAQSDRFSLDAKGLVDLADNRFGNLAVDFLLLEPSAIIANLSGDDVAAHLSLDGPMAAPNIAYRLQARRIAFGATRADGLTVSGCAALNEDRWLIPVEGRADRISGVSESIAPLLVDVRLDGDLAYANGRLLSDNMRLRSSRIDATAVIVADLDRSIYTGALNGRVNGYDVESIGRFNLQTNMDLKSGPNRTIRLAGHVVARSTRITNDSIRDFLGGDALISADVGYDSNGVATVERLRVEAPAFRLAEGRGRYAANGAISFSGTGQSDVYGPLVVDIGGTIADPHAHLFARRPGLGVGLADLDARLRTDRGDYVVTATGNTDYGPLKADVAILSGDGPLRVDLRDGTSLAGVGLTGRVAQTAAGPFAGTLRASGSGIDGTVALSNYEGYQRALVDATANDTRLPGRVDLSINRALIDADIILYDRPQLVGDVQVAGARLGDVYVAAARIDADYRQGAGKAKMLLEGRTRFPFRIAANAQFDPKLWRIAVDGRVNGVDVKSQGPLRIIPEPGGYRMLPGSLSLGRGAIQLSGSYSDTLALHGRLKDVDLSLAEPFVQGLGLSGKATGSLDFGQTGPGAFPTADARLKVENFTRSGLTAVSEPVDIELVGRLEADGGNMRALVTRRGANVGRAQVNLRPLPPGAGSWTTRLMAAPLSGGIRYNGPADVLFSLAALPAQSLKGPIGVAADFDGRVRSPRLTGVVRAEKLIYENGQYGTRLTNMALQGQFTNDRLQVESLTANAGRGTISASGFISLSSQEGYPIQLGIDMSNAQLASGQDLSAQASGSLKIVNGRDQQPTISGTVSLPETHYAIVRQGSAKVAKLTGVRRKPALGRERITGDAESMASLPSAWRLDVAVEADNKIYVTGMGLNSEWAAKLHFGGTSGASVISGTVTLIRGTLGFAGHSFDLTQGRISFNGGDMTNPELSIVATGEIEDVTMNIAISGSAQNPQIAFTSTPALPQDELMARILFGSSVGQLSAIQAVQLAASLNSLRGSGGGLNPLGVLQASSGIDRIRILGEDEETGRGTSLAVGQYITNDVYVEIVTDARGYTATQLEVSLSRALSVLSEISSFGTSSLNLRYRKDY